MNKSLLYNNSEVMRILGAKIIQQDSFRLKIKEILAENTGAAPEIGLDIKLLLQITQSLSKGLEKLDAALSVSRIVLVIALVIVVLLPSEIPVILLVVSILAIIVIRYLKQRLKHQYLKKFSVDEFSLDAIHKEFSKIELDDELVLPSSEQNLVVYSGYNPFVGAGSEPLHITGWSFPISLIPPLYLQRPESTPDGLLTDLDEVAVIMGGQKQAASIVLKLIMQKGWKCSIEEIEAKLDGQAAQIVITNINETALDKIGCSIVELEDGQWIVKEEYRDEVEHILEHYDDKLAGEIIPFEEQDLYREVEKSLNSLRIENLTISDYIFVRGQNVEQSDELFDVEKKRPKQTISASTIKKYAQLKSHIARYYKWISINTWGGEIILSFFLRFSKNGNVLVIEFSPRILTPISEEFRDIENVENNLNLSPLFLIKKMLVLILEPLIGVYKILEGIWRIISFPIYLLNKVVNAMSKNKRKTEPKIWIKLKSESATNHGLTQTLREYIASGKFQSYFQKMDTLMYQRVIEKQLQTTLSKFFEDHNVSTVEFGQRMSAIINNVTNNTLSVEGDFTGNANVNGTQEVQGDVSTKFTQALKNI